MRLPRMDERGIALVIAIFALVVVGTLVAGTFFVGRLEQRVGTNMVYVAQANEAADAGLAAALAEDPATYATMPASWPASGSELALPMDTLGVGSVLRYTPMIRRLNDDLFLVRSVGQRLARNGMVLAAGERGMLVRLERASVGASTVVPLGQRSWIQLY